MSKKDNKRRTHLTETFQSEIQQSSNHNFSMDRTLYKGIKQNDVSKIIDISKQRGTLDKELPSQLEELQRIVVQMRRNYDIIKTQSKHLQQQLEKKRKIAQMLKTQEKSLTSMIQQAKDNLGKTKNQSQNLIFNVQAIVYQHDIYKQMEANLKHDLLILKKRNFDKDMSFKKQNVRLKSVKKDQFNKTRLSFRCKDMLQSIQKTVHSKNIQRTQKINSFYEVLNRRHQNLRKRQERDMQIEQVMMRAMSQKLQEEKQLINMCTVNLFLKKFLKNKMERIIKQHQTVESAYHKIRSNTDITDSKDLIRRFLSREKDYGLLLSTISQKQYLLENLKNQKEELSSKQITLTHQAQHINEKSTRTIDSIEPYQKNMQNLDEQLRKIKEQQDLIKKWAIKFQCAYSGKSKEKVKDLYKNQTLKKLLTDVLSQISRYSDDILGSQNAGDTINTAFLSTKPTSKTFDDDMLVRNFRVKTQAAAEDNHIEVDEKEAFYDGASQAEYFNYNRRATKKSDYNRRFRIKTQNK